MPRLEKASFSRCDLTQGEFRGTRLRGLSFADSDIRGIRVGEVDSFELKGLKINALQAVDLGAAAGGRGGGIRVYSKNLHIS
ncbi:MAG: pentapeptide repeat-containing protein [Alistipes onderdonkii]